MAAKFEFYSYASLPIADSITPHDEPAYRFEYRDHAAALARALAGDAFYITMQQASSSEALLQYLDYSMIEARNYGELFIPAEHRHGLSVWSKPIDTEREAQMKREKHAFISRHMGSDCLDIYCRIVDFMSAQSSTRVADSAWYLSIVGVLPEYQGRGLGVGLLSSVLETTDRLGVATYLETFTPRNESFYTRLGYRVAGSFHEPTIDARYSLMIRSPGGA